MNALKTLLIAMFVMLGLPSQAEASAWWKSNLKIVNEFDGAADVFVNGNYKGSVNGDRTRVFEVNPGYRQVTLRRPGTGYVLLSDREFFYSDSTTRLTIKAPKGELKIRNDSPVPMLISACANEPRWVEPFTNIVLPVRTGNVIVKSQVREREGLKTLTTKTVWAEPGARASTTLRYTPPAKTRLTVVNHDGRDVRIVMNGRDKGTLRSGDRMVLDVRPGEVDLLATEIGGRVIFDDDLFVSRGETERVDLLPRAPRYTTASPASRPPERPHCPLAVSAY